MIGEHLYIVMVGLPARGKSTIAGRLSESLRREGIRTRIFNNGALRRQYSQRDSWYADFFDPRNDTASAVRERFALMNVRRARSFVERSGNGRTAAILDAANVSPDRRRMIRRELPEAKTLFIECRHDDPEILDAGIRLKVESPEFAHLSRMAAIANFRKRIGFYEQAYAPLRTERNFFAIDSFDYRILRVKLTDNIRLADRVRDFLVTPFIRNLYLVRHAETSDNTEDRLGGDAELTPAGHRQARRLARHFGKKRIPLIFTSSLKRTLETSMHIEKAQKTCRVIPLIEFDEINAGVCEGMTYEEVREKMPEAYAARKRNKYHYLYPEGEGYVSMEKRIERGVKKVLFFSKTSENAMIVGHRAVNRMILSYFVFKRKRDVPYIHVPQDRYYHIVVSQNKKVFELKRFS